THSRHCGSRDQGSVSRCSRDTGTTVVGYVARLPRDCPWRGDDLHPTVGNYHGHWRAKATPEGQRVEAKRPTHENGNGGTVGHGKYVMLRCAGLNSSKDGRETEENSICSLVAKDQLSG